MARTQALSVKERHERYFRHYLKSYYGLTPEQHAAQVAAQDGKCALCQQHPPRGQKLHVDHCHATNALRRLLCGNCNWQLGWAERVGVENILEYLSLPPVMFGTRTPRLHTNSKKGISRKPNKRQPKAA